jgi:uncharacterized protein YjbI with pentapeptide repeats
MRIRGIWAVSLAFVAGAFAQGPLAPGAAPAPSMKTLQEIWDRIGELQGTVNTQQQQLRQLQFQNTLLLESAGITPPWQMGTADTSNTTYRYVSLAFSPTGQPSISYYDVGNQDLKYAAFNGTNWQVTIVDSGEGAGQFTSLAFTPGGRPAISYYDATNSDLKYAVFDGGAWQLSTIDSVGNVGQYTSLAFSPAGQPAISYYDVSNTDLKYATFDGANWQFAVVDTNSAGTYSSLGFSGTGEPAIAYLGGGDVKYALYLGEDRWQIRTVDTVGGQFISLAFSSAGDPAVSYHDPGSSSRDLKYAYVLSAVPLTWTNVIVDGAASGSVGQYNSLAFGLNGQPAISYRYDTSAPGEPTIRTLKFARFNGSTWEPSTVSSTVDPEYTSLAFGPDGQPAIAFYDRTSRDLKFVRRAFASPAP